MSFCPDKLARFSLVLIPAIAPYTMTWRTLFHLPVQPRFLKTVEPLFNYDNILASQ